MKVSFPQTHVLLIVLSLGMVTMGFQLLASRLLSPYYGSSIIVWAWLISTFLAAFAIGSLIGGFVNGVAAPRRTVILWVTALLGTTGYVINAVWGRQFLDFAEASIESTNMGLLVSCLLLFLPPIVASSVFTPICVGTVSSRGWNPGLASGLVYGASTIGNIGGVMLTAFVLVPNVPVSQLLQVWAGAAALCFVGLSPFFNPNIKT